MKNLYLHIFLIVISTSLIVLFSITLNLIFMIISLIIIGFLFYSIEKYLSTDLSYIEAIKNKSIDTRRESISTLISKSYEELVIFCGDFSQDTFGSDTVLNQLEAALNREVEIKVYLEHDTENVLKIFKDNEFLNKIKFYSIKKKNRLNFNSSVYRHIMISDKRNYRIESIHNSNENIRPARLIINNVIQGEKVYLILNNFIKKNGVDEVDINKEYVDDGGKNERN